MITGMKIQTAISLVFMSITAVMYVDDADILIPAKNHQESLELIVSRTQSAANICRRGNHQTGGVLCPKKYKWYLIHFQWENAEWHLRECDQVQHFQLKIKDTEFCLILVERLKTKIGQKGL